MTGLVNRERIYLSLPIALQNAVVSMEGWKLAKRRYDVAFEKIHQNVCQNSRLVGGKLLQYQRARLGAFLRKAASKAFWNDRFQEFAINFKSGDPVAEIGKLPILTKGEIKNNLVRLVSKDSAEKTIPCHTSGTTGSGLNFPAAQSAEREQWAVWWRYRKIHGIDRAIWCGYFGGRSIAPLSQKKAPFWRINRPGRQLMFSAYHLSEKTVGEYVHALVKYNITWLHGYPSILALVAGYVIDQRIRSLPPVKIITTGAESLMPHQREIIREAFKAKVVQHYGGAEGVANFSECEYGSLHVDEDFSLVEFVPVEGDDGLFRIIGTNWTNPAFPLIRYDTGDIATLSDVKCPCGRAGRIVASVDGRKEDYLLLPNGVKIGRLDHIFKDLIHIREAQIVQKEEGCAVIKIVKGSEYDRSGEEEKLLKEARQRLGDEIKLSVEYVVAIPRTRSGKLRFVVSELEDGKLNWKSNETDHPIL